MLLNTIPCSKYQTGRTTKERNLACQTDKHDWIVNYSANTLNRGLNCMDLSSL